MNQYILEARSLVKKKQGKFLLNGVHLHVEEGDSLALLGDDWEANQDLIEVLSTMSAPSAGDLFINGLNTKFNLKRTKRILSVIVDIFDNELSVLQNIEIYSKLYDLPKLQLEKEITEYLRVYDMEDYSDHSPDDLNAFQKFKLAYIRTLLTKPKLVFFHENFSSFNDQELFEASDMLDELKKDCTLIMATKNPAMAHRFANKIAIFTHGKVYDYGDLNENIQNKVGNEVIEFSYNEEEIDYLLSRLSKDLDYFMMSDRFYLFLKAGQDSRNFLDIIHSDEVTIRKPDIRDLLIRRRSEHQELES